MINFLASVPKSGNTWVRLWLNAYITGVCNINLKPIANVHDTRIFDYQTIVNKQLKDIDQAYHVYLRPTVLLNMAMMQEISPLIVKTHSINGTWNEIPLFPEGLVSNSVYLVRDPRDVCVSLARHMGKGIDEMIMNMASGGFIIAEDEESVPTWVSSWSDNVTSWEKDYVTVIRYEDLKEDPETHFEKILKTFRIKINKQKLRKAIRLTRLEALMKQEKEKGFSERKRQKMFFGQGQGWQNELTEKQIRRIEEDHGEVMQKYGYSFYKKQSRLKRVK